MGITAMGAPYVGYKFEHVNRRRLRGGWLVKGTVYWTLAPELVGHTGLDALIAGWSRDGYKIGFLIKDDQKIRALNYGGNDLGLLRPQKDEVRDLDATHGTPPGFRWQVWGGHGRRDLSVVLPPNVVTFPVKLILSGGRAPQMIPVASRHLKGSFAQSMGGLWVIGRRRRAAARRRRAVKGGRRARA